MARIILTLVGPWDKPPVFETPFELKPGGHDPSIIDDFRALAAETEGLDAAELKAVGEHRSTVVADRVFEGPGRLEAAGDAARLMKAAFAAGATGIRVETGLKVFGPSIAREIDPKAPELLLHLLVEVLIDDEAVGTEGMQAFDLPDIVVPYSDEQDAAPAQAAAFALAAKMVVDRFAPVHGGVFRASESAPLYAVSRVEPADGEAQPFDNARGSWRLDRKG